MSTYIPNVEACPKLTEGIFNFLKSNVVPPTVTWVGFAEAIFVSILTGFTNFPSLIILAFVAPAGATIFKPLTTFPVSFWLAYSFAFAPSPFAVTVPPWSS